MIGGLANAALESLMFRVLIKTTINAGKGLPTGNEGLGSLSLRTRVRGRRPSLSNLPSCSQHGSWKAETAFKNVPYDPGRNFGRFGSEGEGPRQKGEHRA